MRNSSIGLERCNTLPVACGQAGQRAQVRGREQSEHELNNDNDGFDGAPPDGPDARNGSRFIASLEQVLYMDPELIRARLRKLSAQSAPAQWAAENLKLGANLQQRARRERGAARAEISAEAIGAFEAALGIYCKCKTPEEVAPREKLPWLADSCVNPRTESAIEGVIAFATSPMLSSAEDLQQSIELFQEARSSDVHDSEFETWVLNTINLGCALVLAGKCDAANGCLDRLEEAMQICGTVLEEPRIVSMPYERAAACINLAEALTSMAVVSLPDDRVDYLDRALRALASALIAVAPKQLSSILNVESGACA